jgi:peptide-methionine (R)-S-oxide reductase
MKRIAAWAAPLVIGAILVVAIVAGRKQPTQSSDRVRPSDGPTALAAATRDEQADPTQKEEGNRTVTKLERSEEEWKRLLSPEEYHILREKGTERAFTGKYWDTKTAGTYKCAGCGLELFESDTKFDSGCGWPSFFKPLEGARLTETADTSLGMKRIEITCSRCGGHLGHVFPDGPKPTGLRYCINSVSIDLDPKGADPQGADPKDTAPKAAGR